MNKCIKGFISGVCFTTIIVTSISLVSGQTKNNGKKIEATLIKSDLKVNSKLIELNTIKYDNKTYIPINYISELLKTDISWDENTNTLNISDKNMITPNIQNNINEQKDTNSKELTKRGTIKGTITWNSDNSETKADGNSKILLVPKNISKNDVNKNDIFIFSNLRDFDKITSKDLSSKNLYATTADENGKYEISDINDGKYILITVSKNTQRKFNCIDMKSISEPITDSTAALLKPLAESIDESTDQLVTLLSRFSKFYVQEIEINNNTLEIYSNFTLSK